MKRLFYGVAMIIAFLTAAAVGRAEMITGTLSTSDNSAVNISNGTNDWVYWGQNEMDVKSGGANSFSDLTGMVASGSTISYSWWPGGNPEQKTVTYTGGTPTASRTACNGYRYWESGTALGRNVSFTHTLIGTSETLVIYLGAFGSGGQYNLTATIGGSTTTLYSSQTFLSTDGSGHYGGVLTLNVAGTLGETMTFTITAANSSCSNFTINAATATINAVPEPNAMALAAVALIGLFACLWRKRRK